MFRNKGTSALLIAVLVLVGYITFLLIANYKSNQRLVSVGVERISEDMTKRAVAVSYFASERINDLKAIAAGRELAFYYANKALGMSLRYGLSANIEEIKSSFERLLKEKKIGEEPIYSRIDFIDRDADLHVTASNQHGPVLRDEDLQAFPRPGASDIDIFIHRQSTKSRLAFSMPYYYKDGYMGQIITWVELDTIYRRLIQVNERTSQRVMLVGYDTEFLPLSMEASPFGVPSPEQIRVSAPVDFESRTADGSVMQTVVLKVPVEKTPLFILSITPMSELYEQNTVWGRSLFLVFLSLVVLAGVGFLLRIKDQNLILSVRLEESSRQQETISRKNLQLQKEINDRKRTEEELKAAKEAAETANRAKSEFLANMSHELRTPLHHILGFTELLAAESCGPLNEAQKQYLNHSINSSRHLLSLINDILDITKVEAGKTALRLSEVDLPLLLRDSLVKAREKAMENGIELSTKLEDVPERIIADERILRQILYNLLSNAVKFTPHGSICLSARRLRNTNGRLVAGNGRRVELELKENRAWAAEAGFLEVSVADTGIGLPEGTLEIIFKPLGQEE